MKVVKLFLKKINFVKNLPKSGFKDKYIKLYSDNQISRKCAIYELIINKHGIEFGFYIDGFHELGSFRIASMGDEKVDYSNDQNYELPFKEYTHLRFSHVSVDENYRQNSIMSYSLSKVIVSILIMYKDKNFIVDLKNTSHVTNNPYKIYDSILPNNNSSGFQYRLFSINNRENDIFELQENIKKYSSKFTNFSG